MTFSVEWGSLCCSLSGGTRFRHLDITFFLAVPTLPAINYKDQLLTKCSQTPLLSRIIKYSQHDWRVVLVVSKLKLVRSSLEPIKSLFKQGEHVSFVPFKIKVTTKERVLKVSLIIGIESDLFPILQNTTREKINNYVHCLRCQPTKELQCLSGYKALPIPWQTLYDKYITYYTFIIENCFSWFVFIIIM